MRFGVPSLTSLLSRWLILGFGFLFLLVVLVVSASVRYLDALRIELENVADIQMQRVSRAHEMRMITRERILSLERIFLEDDPFERDALHMAFNELGGRFVALRSGLEPLAKDAAERQLLADFRQETVTATILLQKVVDLFQQGRLAEGRSLLLREAIPTQSRVTAASDAVHAFYQQRGQATVEHARQVYGSAFRIVVGLGVGAILLTLLTAVLVVRRTLRDRQTLLEEIETRREAEEELLELSGDLEEIVAARTARLQEATDLLKEAHRIGQMGHWEWDIPADAMRWSDEVYHLFGMGSKHTVTTYSAFLDAVHPDDREKVVAAMDKALVQGHYRIVHRVLWPDGHLRYMEELGRVTYDDNERPLRVVGTVQDITEEQRLQQQLWDLAHHDSLTGLPNRNLLIDRLEQAIGIAERQNGTLAVALFDLDRFKQANDSLGHAAGDRLLMEVANRLRGSVRQGDIVARFAGDEFVAVFPTIGSTEEAGRVITKIQAALSEPCQLHGVDWQISASIGIAFYPGDARDAQDLLQAADEAMYAVKQSGRNGFRVFETPQTLQ